MWQISYPPANGVSQGNYFLPKNLFQLKTPTLILVARLNCSVVFIRNDFFEAKKWEKRDK